MTVAAHGIGTGTEHPGASGWILAGAVSLSLHMLLLASVALDIRGRPAPAAAPRTEMVLSTPPTVAGGEIALRRIDAGAASNRQTDSADQDRLAAEEAEIGERANDAQRLGAETPESLAAEDAERITAETPDTAAAQQAERITAEASQPLRATTQAAAPQRLQALPQSAQPQRAQPLRARSSSPATIRAEPAPPRTVQPARIQAQPIRPQATRPATVAPQATVRATPQVQAQRTERIASQTTRPARIRAEGSAPRAVTPRAVARPSSAPIAGDGPQAGQTTRAERTVQNTDEEVDPAILARRTGADARLSDRVAAPSTSAAARAVMAQRAAAQQAAQEAAAAEPREDPQVVRNRERYGALVQTLRGLPQTACLLALPALGPEGDLRLELFGSDQAALASFGDQLQATVGAIPEMQVHPVSPTQCDALDFARASPAWPETGLSFTLTRHQIVSGTQLEGEVHNGDGKILHLLMIDSFGRVIRLDPFLRWSAGRTLFEIPVQAQSGGPKTWQLLMTLGAKGPLQVVQAVPQGRAVSVEQFFGALFEEIKAAGAMPDLSVVAFSLN